MWSFYAYSWWERAHLNNHLVSNSSHHHCHHRLTLYPPRHASTIKSNEKQPMSCNLQGQLSSRRSNPDGIRYTANWEPRTMQTSQQELLTTQLELKPPPILCSLWARGLRIRIIFRHLSIFFSLFHVSQPSLEVDDGLSGCSPPRCSPPFSCRMQSNAKHQVSSSASFFFFDSKQFPMRILVVFVHFLWFRPFRGLFFFPRLRSYWRTLFSHQPSCALFFDGENWSP